MWKASVAHTQIFFHTPFKPANTSARKKTELFGSNLLTG